MNTDLRDPSNYDTLVRVSTPADRYATALLMFCHHNDVRALCNLFLLKSKAARYTKIDYQVKQSRVIGYAGCGCGWC